MSLPIAALFVRTDSIYKEMGLDCWDEERNATNYQGPNPVIAHPPCRGWGCLRKFSNATDEEKALGPWAVSIVRRFRGVLEHPRGSSLWVQCGLPRPEDDADMFGGFTVSLDQFVFGHRAQKATWLYVCGTKRRNIPPVPLKFAYPSHVVTNVRGLRAGMPGFRTEITQRERDATPLAFATWLVVLANSCRIGGSL